MQGKDNDDGYRVMLRREGYKITKHRVTVLEVLGNSDQPISAEQIFLELKGRNDSISLSSVYRILEAFEYGRLITRFNIAGENRSYYELAGREHRHYLICSGCKKTFPIIGCPLKEYEKRLKTETEFQITGHRLEIFGLCNECNKAGKKPCGQGGGKGA